MTEGYADETCTDVAIFAGMDITALLDDKLGTIDAVEMVDVAAFATVSNN